jgi:hypothetical protein
MIRILIIVSFFLSAELANGQTMITGLVNSKEERAGLSGVSVTAKDKISAAILTYALTNDKGMYRLNFTSAADTLLITVSGLNIEKQTVTVVNRNQDLNFDVRPQAIKLKEIKINPPKIRRLNDTISYLVDGFKDKNDRTIGDVLRKMPGIEVKGDGSILYNNRPINKFYIEHTDLLQGRYGIATNNIEAKDVSTVQVLENHQPVKALKNKEFSDEAALNITLKNSAKGVLVANAQVGTGLSPILWNNELFSMYFNKKWKNISTYKGNNTGDDPGSDFTSHYSGPNRADRGTTLSIQSPSAPAISQKRYLFNRAHAFTVNNSWTYGKEKQVNANLSYLTDRQERSSFSRSVYYLPVDSMLTIEEGLASADRLNQLDATIQVNVNNDYYYLDNALTFKGNWNQAEGTVTQTNSIFQQLNNPLYALSNTLTLIKNHKKRTFKIYSYNAYNRTPQILSVQPALYDWLISGLAEPGAMKQELTRNGFSSVSRLSFGLSKDHFKQNYTAGFNATLQQFQSNLYSQSRTGNASLAVDSLRNDLGWNKYEVYLNPDYTYVKDDFRIKATLPLNYTSLNANDLLSAINKNVNRLLFNPSLLLNYDLNQFVALSANASHNRRLGELDNLFAGYIMQSYRNLVRNDGQLPENQNQLYSLNLNYRHPVHAVFINLGSSFTRNKLNLLYSYDYQGILSTKKTYNIPNIASTYSIYGRFSKGMDAINGTITLDANYNSNSGSQMGQNQMLIFKNETYVIKPGISAKMAGWASFSYSFQFVQNKNTISKGISNFAPIYTNTQYTRLNFFPLDGLTINLTYEYFYSSAITAGNRVMSFADTGIRYAYKNIEFGIDYTNIFNEKQYISAAYMNTSSYYYAYDLRPAQVLLKVRLRLGKGSG